MSKLILAFQSLLYVPPLKREAKSEGQVSDHSRMYPVGVFCLAWLLYWLPAALAGHLQSLPVGYFDKLANAFLDGRLYLLDPPIVHDLTFHNGNWYVPFPPLPALLMIPWVWVFGDINTTVFTIFMGAINVTLAFFLLEALRKNEWIYLKTSDNIWFVLFFGFGTVHWYLSTMGTVWYASQICTVTFMLLAAWCGISCRSPLWVGSALSLAMLARPHVVLAYPLLLASMIVRHRGHETETTPFSLVKTIFTSVFPITISIGLLLAYNYLRFDNLFDFGYHTQNVSRRLAAQLQTYGQFDFHFVRENLYVMLFALPVWSAKGNFIVPSLEGMSLLLTSPALVYLSKARLNSLMASGAWLATALLLTPLLMYYNTGRDQFGYRFSMDFIVPMLLLLAIGQKQEISKNLRMLIIVSIGINAWGVLWIHSLW